MSRSRLIDAAVGAVYAAAAMPEQWPVALDAIAACFDAIGTALVLRRGDAGASAIVSPALAAASRDYEAWAWKLDFCIPRAVEHSLMDPTACYSDRHLATPEEIATHPFYSDFRTPHGLGPYLGTQLLPQSDVVAILTVQGRRERETFDDIEIEEYARLARHAERALMLTVRLVEAEARSQALEDALSRLSCGVFTLSDSGQVTFANDTGRALLDRGLLTRAGLTAASLPAAVGFEPVNAPPAAPRLIAGSGGDVVALYVLPVGTQFSAEIAQTFAGSRALVLAITYPGPRPDAVLIHDLLGLTHGEARLASLIGGGQTPRQAAGALGITEESARTVLKRVFAKTGTSRQTELATMLARVILTAK